MSKVVDWTKLDEDAGKVMFMRLATTITGMALHLRTGGKLKLTRMATPALLRQVATEFTGKSYPRSQNGMRAALTDLEALKEKLIADRKPKE